MNGDVKLYLATVPSFTFCFVEVLQDLIARIFLHTEHILDLIHVLAQFLVGRFVGGTAIDLELRGIADGQIMEAGISSQLFEMINIMLSPVLATAMSVVVVILLLTFLVTSADSAVLIINTIAAGGDASQKGNVHIITWGAALTLVIAVLLLAGGLSAINTAMIIGALPFSFVMALMGVSLLKALIRDGMRDNSENKS